MPRSLSQLHDFQLIRDRLHPMRRAVFRRVRRVEFQREAARRLDLAILYLNFAEVILGRQITAAAIYRRFRAIKTRNVRQWSELREIIVLWPLIGRIPNSEAEAFDFERTVGIGSLKHRGHMVELRKHSTCAHPP